MYLARLVRGGVKREKKMIKREKQERKGERKIFLFLLASTVIPAKLKLPKEVSFAPSPLPSINPPTRPIPPQPIFFVSLAHFTLVRRPSHARHFFASCQPAKSFSDVAPTDKWSALGLLACGHYWSMRFSVLLPSFSRHFFILLFLNPIFRSTPLSIVSSMLYLPSLHPFMPIFTFYFTSRSFIIFLISRGYPFVRDNCRKWEGSGRVDGKRFFVARSNLGLKRIKILYLSYIYFLLIVIKFYL